MNPTDTMGIMSQMQKTADAYRSNPAALNQKVRRQQGRSKLPPPTVEAIVNERLKREQQAKKRQIEMELQQDPKTVAQQTEAFLNSATQGDVLSGVADVMDMRNMRRQKGAQRAAQQFSKAPMGTGIMSALTGQGQPKPSPSAQQAQRMGMRKPVQRAVGGLARFQEGGITEADIDTYINTGNFRGRNVSSDVNDNRITRSKKSKEQIREILQRAQSKFERQDSTSPRTRGSQSGIGFVPSEPTAKDIEEFRARARTRGQVLSDEAIIKAIKQRDYEEYLLGQAKSSLTSEGQGIGGRTRATKDPVIEDPITSDAVTAKPQVSMSQAEYEQMLTDLEGMGDESGPEQQTITLGTTPDAGISREDARNQIMGETAFMEQARTLAGPEDDPTTEEKEKDVGLRSAARQKQKAFADAKTKLEEQTDEREKRLFTDDDALFSKAERDKAVQAGFYSGLTPFGLLSDTLVGERRAGRKFDLSKEKERRGQEDRILRGRDIEIQRVTAQYDDATKLAEIFSQAKRDDAELGVEISKAVLNSEKNKTLQKQIENEAKRIFLNYQTNKEEGIATARAAISEARLAGLEALRDDTKYTEAQSKLTNIIKKHGTNENDYSDKVKKQFAAAMTTIKAAEQDYITDLIKPYQDTIARLQATTVQLRRGGLAAFM